METSAAASASSAIVVALKKYSDPELSSCSVAAVCMLLFRISSAFVCSSRTRVTCLLQSLYCCRGLWLFGGMLESSDGTLWWMLVQYMQ
jgi:hypothetical protein